MVDLRQRSCTNNCYLKGRPTLHWCLSRISHRTNFYQSPGSAARAIYPARAVSSLLYAAWLKTTAPPPLPQACSLVHHRQTSGEMGKLVRGQERAVLISLPHMEAVPSLSKECGDRAKFLPDPQTLLEPQEVWNPIPTAKGEDSNSCTPITSRLQFTL